MNLRSLLAGLTLAIVVGCLSPGQRLLDARIEKDGKVLLQTKYAVPDSWSKAQAWRRLAAHSFQAVGELTPDPGAPGEVTLQGKVRIVLVHGGTPYATSEVEELRLLADPAKPGSWKLSVGEVDRTRESMR